jgi:4-hydroxy-tetrahydrodipicolinate synthase
MDGEQIDFDRLHAAIEVQARGGVTGVVPCGTTGESPTLTNDEQRDVIRHTIEHAKPLGMLVVAGVGSNCTRHAIEMHRFAAESGADAALHVTPYYNKPSPDGLYAHYSAIADSCDLPIVLYNVPARTGVMLSIETVVRLSAHPNIVAVKDATGSLDQASLILEQTDLQVLSGDDPLTLPMIAIGGSGVISVVSNIMPAEVASMVLAAIADQLDDARELHYDLLPLARALLSLGPNPTPVKAALAIRDRDSGAVRLPLTEIDSVARERLRVLLETDDRDAPMVRVMPVRASRSSVTPGAS